MGCLTTAGMNMRATVLKAGESPEGSGTGKWQVYQNPDSGAVEQLWVDDTATLTEKYESVPVMARGVINSGILGAGDTQKFNDVYLEIDWVKMRFPPGYNITRRDRVVNIRDLDGNTIWKESTINGTPPTEFTVMGITPVINAFGRAVEYIALLKRSEVQS